MRRPVRVAHVTEQPPACVGCGEPNASFGIGPPAQEKTEHRCATCWKFTPHGQAAIAARCAAALEE